MAGVLYFHFLAVCICMAILRTMYSMHERGVNWADEMEMVSIVALVFLPQSHFIPQYINMDVAESHLRVCQRLHYL